jgi:hypothetical protein
VLREVREVTMTTWIMQNVGEIAAAAEFALRVTASRRNLALRSGDEQALPSQALRAAAVGQS